MSTSGADVGVIHDLITNGRNKVAEALLKRALEIEPSDRALRFELGRLNLFGKKDLEQSEHIFRELLIHDPDSTSFLIHLYLSLQGQRKIDAAEALIEKLHSMPMIPERSVVLALHADFKCWAHVPEWKKYLPQVEEAMKMEPENALIAQVMANFLTNLPETRYQNGGEKVAFDFVEGWLQTHPEDQHMLYRLAVLLRMGSKLNAAGKILGEIIQQNPDNEEYVRLFQENQKVLDYWRENEKNYPPHVKKTVIKD